MFVAKCFNEENQRPSYEELLKRLIHYARGQLIQRGCYNELLADSRSWLLVIGSSVFHVFKLTLYKNRMLSLIGVNVNGSQSLEITSVLLAKEDIGNLQIL